MRGFGAVRGLLALCIGMLLMVLAVSGARAQGTAPPEARSRDVISAYVPAYQSIELPADVCQVVIHTAKLESSAPLHANSRDVSPPVPITYTVVNAAAFMDATGRAYTGISTDYWHFSGIPNLTASAFMATGVNDKTRVIVGTMLKYKVYQNSRGWLVSLGAGLTGYDVANGVFETGKHLGVAMLSVGIPIGK